MRLSTVLALLAPVSAVFAIDTATHSRIAETFKRDENNLSAREICLNEHALAKRATPVDVGAGVNAGVTLPSVGLSLGNITTKIGNINLTVTNVTISTGNIDIENISIGNITVIVSVPLPGASPVQAFSAFTPGSSIGTSTAAPTSTVSGATSITQPATTITSTPSPTAARRGLSGLVRRQDAPDTTTIDLSTATPSSTDTAIGVSASGNVNVSGNPITLDTGSVFTEIGNVSIFVGNVNVSIGDVKIKNVTLGNIFILVQVGQPDLGGLVSNVTNRLLNGQ